jgi:acyl carrier protein phosphodiesterase
LLPENYKKCLKPGAGSPGVGGLALKVHTCLPAKAGFQLTNKTHEKSIFAKRLKLMNFLAHAHLSGDNDEILFGNFIADAVKGMQWKKYDANIRAGILLHRQIDTYTDRHPVVKRSIGRIRDDYGRYSGIVVDIYYDHFLADGWNSYHPTALRNFSRHVYAVLTKRFLILPDRTKRMLPFLVAQDWLTNYARFSGLEQVFRGMDRRTALLSGMSSAVAGLEKNYEALRNDFNAFYPELQSFAAVTLKDILENGQAASASKPDEQ